MAASQPQIDLRCHLRVTHSLFRAHSTVAERGAAAPAVYGYVGTGGCTQGGAVPGLQDQSHMIPYLSLNQAPGRH